MPRKPEVTAQKRTLVDQDKSDLEIDAVFSNFPVFNDDLLLLDPRAFDIFECLGYAFDAFLDSIIEASFGTGNYLRNSGYITFSFAA
jgi:hypothetical protein